MNVFAIIAKDGMSYLEVDLCFCIFILFILFYFILGASEQGAERGGERSGAHPM